MNRRNAFLAVLAVITVTGCSSFTYTSIKCGDRSYLAIGGEGIHARNLTNLCEDAATPLAPTAHSLRSQSTRRK